MTVDGLWKISIKMPMGTMETELVLKTEGDVLTGLQTGQGQTLPILDARYEGDQLSWVNDITKPMKMKLVFTATIAGDELTGKVKAGPLGSPSFKGVRVPAAA